MDLMTDVSAWEYPRGRGGIRPFLTERHQHNKDGIDGMYPPNEYAEFRMGLGFVERRFQST